MMSLSVLWGFFFSFSNVISVAIISAAHCFWDEPTLTVRNYSEYQIIAGRSTSNYTTEQNEYSQIVDVEAIHVPSQ